MLRRTAPATIDDRRPRRASPPHRSPRNAQSRSSSSSTSCTYMREAARHGSASADLAERGGTPPIETRCLSQHDPADEQLATARDRWTRRVDDRAWPGRRIASRSTAAQLSSPRAGRATRLRPDPEAHAGVTAAVLAAASMRAASAQAEHGRRSASMRRPRRGRSVYRCRPSRTPRGRAVAHRSQSGLVPAPCTWTADDGDRRARRATPASEPRPIERPVVGIAASVCRVTAVVVSAAPWTIVPVGGRPRSSALAERADVDRVQTRSSSPPGPEATPVLALVPRRRVVTVVDSAQYLHGHPRDLDRASSD